MLGRAYSVVMEATAVAAAKDLIRLSAPSTGIVVVTKAWIGQEATDDLNEAMGAILQSASSDGTGTSATPVAKEAGSTAFGGSAVVDLSADTTQSDVYVREAWNLAAGWVWTPFSEDDAIVVSPSARVVLRLPTAPSASMTITAGMEFREIGT